jgi:hypothetical protein
MAYVKLLSPMFTLKLTVVLLKSSLIAEYIWLAKINESVVGQEKPIIKSADKAYDKSPPLNVTLTANLFSILSKIFLSTEFS